MAIPKHISDLINKLNDKTMHRKLTWLPTSRETEFQCSFSEAAVTTDSWIGEGAVNKVDFSIYNRNGGQIERIFYSETDEEYATLFAFYVNVKNSYLKIDETYNNIFSELDKL